MVLIHGKTVKDIASDLGARLKQPVKAHPGMHTAFFGNQALLNLGCSVEILLHDPTSLLQMVSGFGELSVAGFSTVFQGQNTLTGPDAGPQHISIDRFDEKIVGTGLHALD